MNMTGHSLHARARNRTELISWHVLSRPGHAGGDTSWGTVRVTERPHPQFYPDRSKTQVPPEKTLV